MTKKQLIEKIKKQYCKIIENVSEEPDMEELESLHEDLNNYELNFELGSEDFF